jgi:tetratricopeptide (TPR) repeat protein
VTENSIMENKASSGFFQKRFNAALVISLAFFAIEFILVHFHEPWGDEIHSWAIAFQSHSLRELIYNSRYEGHPKLWYILLFLLQKFTANIFYMQVLHVCIASLAVFVFCFFSPFGLLKNILFCSGYFFAYEYSIISRNYAIEVVLLFLCAGIYSNYSGKYLLLLSVLFFLLFQTTVYGLIIGASFYCYVIWSLYSKRTVSIKKLLIQVLIVLSGIIISVISIKPPLNSGFSVWHTKLTIYNYARVLSTVFDSYFPLPLFNSKIWNSNILDVFFQHVFIQGPLAVIILVLVGILFKGNKKIMFLFYIATLGILLFTYTKYFGRLRHHGHLYLLFVLCYWLFTSENKAQNKLKESAESLLDKFSIWLNKYFVTLILLTQLAGACFANVRDVKYVFSYDKPVAGYLNANSLDSLPIMGDGDYSVSGIAGIMNKDIFFMRPKYWGRYIILDSNWGDFIKFSEIDMVNEVDSITDLKKSDAIVILSYPFNDKRLKNWTLIDTFKGSITTEDYSVFRVKYVPPDPIKINASGELLLSRGYVSEAQKLFTKAIRLKPDFAIAYMNLADCYNNGSNNFDKALIYIDSAIKYAPDNVNVVFDKGAILFNKGDNSHSLNYFKETINLNPGFLNAYFSMARCYLAKNENDSAIFSMNSVLRINPKSPEAYKLLSLCYKNKGNSTLADVYEKKAQQLSTNKY